MGRHKCVPSVLHHAKAVLHVSGHVSCDTIKHVPIIHVFEKISFGLSAFISSDFMRYHTINV